MHLVAAAAAAVLPSRPSNLAVLLAVGVGALEVMEVVLGMMAAVQMDSCASSAIQRQDKGEMQSLSSTLTMPLLDSVCLSLSTKKIGLEPNKAVWLHALSTRRWTRD